MEKIKILLIEDEIITATDLKEILTQRGHQIIGIAKNHNETLNMIEYERPDLALVDIKLRNSLMNGIQIAEEILNVKDIPYIYLTSQSDSETFKEAKQTSPRAFLTKPFRENEVIFQVELIYENYIAQLQKSTNPSLSDSIFVFVDNSHFRIEKKEIMVIEADSSYVKVYLKNIDKPILITMNLKKIGSYLTGPNFYRLSRKHIINLDYLSRFDNDKIWLKEFDQTIPIPQNGKKELMNQLAVVKIV